MGTDIGKTMAFPDNITGIVQLTSKKGQVKNHGRFTGHKSGCTLHIGGDDR